jgi:serine/threonine protein kinase
MRDKNISSIPLFQDYNGGDAFSFQGKKYYRDGNALGKGTYGTTYRFKSNSYPPDVLVIKAELGQKTAVQEQILIGHHYQLREKIISYFPDGEYFALEARFNKDIHGLGELSGPVGSADLRKKPHYILMPFFKGILFSEKKFKSTKEFIFYFIQVAAFIHTKMHTQKFTRPEGDAKEPTGLVHGDIKGNNIILQEKDCQVIDFGLTSYIGELTGGFEKTPNYECISPHIAPELFNKLVPACPSQDAYSLGNLLKTIRKFSTIIVSQEDCKNLNPIIKNLCAPTPNLRTPIFEVISTLNHLYCSVVMPAPTTAIEKKISQAITSTTKEKKTTSSDQVQSNAAGMRPTVNPLHRADADKTLGLVNEKKPNQHNARPPLSQLTTAQIQHLYARQIPKKNEEKPRVNRHFHFDPYL